MKTVKILLVTLICAAAFSSCNKDEEEEENTPVATPESIAGLYNVVDGCEAPHIITIEYNATTGALVLNNLYDDIDNISFTLDGNNMVLENASGSFYNSSNATGTVSGTTITLNYTVADATGATLNCTATLEQQNEQSLAGMYTATDDCETDPYTVTIQEDAANSNYELDNLYDIIDNVDFTVSGNTIAIVAGTGAGLDYSGSGTVAGNVITLNYTIVDALGTTRNCTATLNPQ